LAEGTSAGRLVEDPAGRSRGAERQQHARTTVCAERRKGVGAPLADGISDTILCAIALMA
jgi:hypothetical protein